MKKKRQLPPLWVTCFSYLFCLFLLAPILVVMHLFGAGSVEALGISLDAEAGAPVVWMLALDAFLFAGGITGAAILMGTSWAYRFGIVYATAGIILVGVAYVAAVDGIRENLDAVFIQCSALGVFLAHLLKNRRRWEAEATQSLAPGENAPVTPNASVRA